MTCHHIPSVRCPECADNRPSMGYWTCAALREENARLTRERDKAEAKLARVVDILERELNATNGWSDVAIHRWRNVLRECVALAAAKGE